MTDAPEPAMIDPVEPLALPWLGPAVELEALAVGAQGGKWTEQQAWQVVNLWVEATHLMATYNEPPPVVEPEPPVEPPVEPVEPVDPPPITPPPVVEPPPVTVPPEPITPPPPLVDSTGKLIRAKRPPEAARTLSAKPSTLLNVVRNQAQPGDHIVLEDGDYGAGYNFDKAFPPERKLVIRAKTPMGANFTVPPRFTAPGYWLNQVRCSYDRGTAEDSFGAKIEADNITITQCWFQGKDGIASRAGAIGNVQIGWNRFTGRNKTGSSCDHIYFWLPDAGAYLKPTDGPNNISIHYNFFDDPVSPAAEDHHIYFGATKAAAKDLPMMESVYVDYNYWAPTSKRTRPLYMKRGCVIRRNTCLSKERNFGIRHGQESIVWANIATTGFVHFSGAMVIGASPQHHHDIRGNEFPASEINLFCGSETAAQYQAASYAMLASNLAKGVNVGLCQGRTVSAAQGGLTKGVKILLGGRMKPDQVHKLSQIGTTTEDSVGDLYIPQTDRLTEERVGLETANQGAER